MTDQNTPTLYDDIRYPARSFEYTHPNRLATVAALNGMTPAPIAHCRVLELGCGVCGNIIPMAYQNPESQFVGIDLSGEAIAAGQHRITALGLRNLSVHHLDILDINDQFGRFDYIIAHGVYSWVPAPVRQKILAISKQLLNSQGVSYISYNAHPFSHMRDMVRDMMLFHTREMTGSREKIDQARGIAKFITEGSDENSIHGRVMRAQNNRIEGIYDELLFHDDLNESAEAFLLHKFVEAAAQHGLQYLGDVDYDRQDMSKYSEVVRSILQTFPPEALMLRDQYQDFIEGVGFRRTLLCRDDVELRRTPPVDFVKWFFLSMPAKPVSENDNSENNKSKNDKSQNDKSEKLASEELNYSDLPPHKMLDSLPANNEMVVEGVSPLADPVLHCLRDAWPRSLTFNELTEGIFETLGPEVNVERRELVIEELCDLLARAARRGDIKLRFDRPSVSTIVSETPEASLVARLQSQAGEIVTNLLHSMVILENAMSRQFLIKVDGTRTIDELQAEVDRLSRSNPDGSPESPDVMSLLQKFAKSALLVR